MHANEESPVIQTSAPPPPHFIARIRPGRYNRRNMSPDNPNPELAALRKRIDELDRRIVDQLNERAKVVIEIGKLKRDGSTPVYAPDREKQVLEQVRAYNPGPLPDSCLASIWRELMSGSFALE